MKVYNTIMRVVYGIIAVAVIGAVAYFGYQYYFGKTTIESNGKFFSLVVPQKLDLVQNEKVSVDDADMALVDSKKGVYIFGYSYEKAEDFKGGVDKDIASTKENTENRNVTELKEEKLGDFDSYTYTYCYKDEYEKDFYAKVIFIDAVKGTYFLILECPEGEVDTYSKDLDAIAGSFVEL